MATSLIFLQENAIIWAAVYKFIQLGSEASQRIIGGLSPAKQDEKAEQILMLLTAYRRKSQLTEDNMESILIALKNVSGGNSFPTVDSIIGMPNNYNVTGITIGVGGGGSGTGDSRPTFDAYNPASGMPPTVGSGDNGEIRQGDQFYATDGLAGPGDGNPIGTVFGQSIYKNCIFTAKIDGAGNNRAEWYLSQDTY